MTRFSYRQWLHSEEEFLKNNYGSLSSTQIATKLHRTSKSVRSKAQTMNLKQETEEVNYDREASWWISEYVVDWYLKNGV